MVGDFMLNCYQELIFMINNSLIKKELKNSLEAIYKDNYFLDKINSYHNTYDENLRREIYANEKYKKYKKLENRLNFLILSCNKYLGEIRYEDN